MVPLSAMLRLAVVISLGLAFSASANAVRAQENPQQVDARYQTTVEQAVHEFSLGNWAEARALFRRAHALLPSARTFRGMGMAAFELKMYVEALRELSAALADTQRPLTEDQRKQVQSLIDQSRAYVGRYQVVLEPATALPKVDDQEALFEPGNVLLLSLGDHVVSASAEGYQEVRVPLRVEGGEDLVLKIQLSPVNAAPAAVPVPQAAPAPLPPPAATTPAPQAATHGSKAGKTVGWIGVVGTVAFGGASAAFWLMGSTKYDSLKKSCGAVGCTDQQIKDSGVKSKDTLTTVFLGLAGASAVTAVVGFIVGFGGGGGSEQASLDHAQATAHVSVGPTSVQLQGSF